MMVLLKCMLTPSVRMPSCPEHQGPPSSVESDALGSTGCGESLACLQSMRWVTENPCDTWDMLMWC